MTLFYSRRAQLDSVLILEKSELDKLSREINLKEETIELGKEKLSEVVLRRSQVETEVKSVQALQQKVLNLLVSGFYF